MELRSCFTNAGVGMPRTVCWKLVLKQNFTEFCVFVCTCRALANTSLASSPFNSQSAAVPRTL